MELMKQLEVWFLVGSQHLYGATTLKQVADHAHTIASQLNEGANLPLKIVLKPTGTTLDEISAVARDANHDERCAGLMVWMHTFSPAKMWIPALSQLQKPLLQFHTQFNRDLPWSEIDMDFMNLNQTAHGGREFGFMGPACGCRAPWWWVTGKMKRPDRRLATGCASPPPSTTAATSRSPVLATTCATWRSPRATRLRPRSSSAIR